MPTDRMPLRISLRVLGRLLDQDRARMVTVCEIAQGFLLHYFQNGDCHRAVSSAVHGAEVLDYEEMFHKQRSATRVSSKGFGGLLGVQKRGTRRFQSSHPLCPMGYEDALRAIGEALDSRAARSATITELDSTLLIEYVVERADFVLQDGQRVVQAGRRQETYTAKQLDDLVSTHRAEAIDRVRQSGAHLSQNPMDVGSYLSAAPVLEDHGQDADAEDLYVRALAITPNHPELRFHLARHARRRGDWKAALKHLDVSIGRAGGEGRFHHLRGRILYEHRRHAEALEAFRQAVMRDPDNSVYHFHLNQLQALTGRGRRDATPAARPAPEARIALPDESAAQASSDTPAIAAERLPVVEEEETPAWEMAADVTVGYSPDPVGTYGPAGQLMDLPLAASFAVPDSHDVAGPHDTVARIQAQAATGGPARDPHDVAASPFALAATDLPGEAADVGWPIGAAAPELRALPPHDEPPGVVIPFRDRAQTPDNAATGDDDWTKAVLPLTPDAPLPINPSPPSPAVGQDTTGQPAAAGAFHGLAATAEPILPAGTDDVVQLAAAVLHLEELVRAEPHRADLHRKLGFLLSKQGRSEEASAAFRKAVACGRRRMAG